MLFHFKRIKNIRIIECTNGKHPLINLLTLIPLWLWQKIFRLRVVKLRSVFRRKYSVKHGISIFHITHFLCNTSVFSIHFNRYSTLGRDITDYRRCWWSVTSRITDVADGAWHHGLQALLNILQNLLRCSYAKEKIFLLHRACWRWPPVVPFKCDQINQVASWQTIALK
jgi:hypothetical protein